MKSLSRLMAVTRKEVRQLRRDRLTFAMIFGMPMMQILLFGYAINTDVRNLTTAIADESNTHLSREFVAQLRETQVVDIQHRVVSAAELEELLRTGEISIGVVVVDAPSCRQGVSCRADVDVTIRIIRKVAARECAIVPV